MSALAKIRKLLLSQGADALTEKQFARKYMQSVDQSPPESREAILRSIMEHGWQPGFGPNLLPPYRGGLPTNVVDKRYAPRAGSQVYLVPSEYTRDTGNGLAAIEGWRPQPHEVLRPEVDYPDMYEEYLKALQRKFQQP